MVNKPKLTNLIFNTMKDKVLILFGKRVRKESLRQFDKLLHANCLAYNQAKEIWECVTLNTEKK